MRWWSRQISWTLETWPPKLTWVSKPTASQFGDASLLLIFAFAGGSILRRLFGRVGDDHCRRAAALGVLTAANDLRDGDHDRARADERQPASYTAEDARRFARLGLMIHVTSGFVAP